MTTQTRPVHDDGDPLAAALSSAVHGLRTPELHVDLGALQRRGRRRRWARRTAAAAPLALLAVTAVVGVTRVSPSSHVRVVPAATAGTLDDTRVAQALDRAVAGAVPDRHVTSVTSDPGDAESGPRWVSSLSDRGTEPSTELFLQVVPGPLDPREPLTSCGGPNISGCTEETLVDGSRLVTGTVSSGSRAPGTGGDPENPLPLDYDLPDEPFATLVTVGGGLVSATATIGVEEGGPTRQLGHLPQGSPFTPTALRAIVSDPQLRQALDL